MSGIPKRLMKPWTDDEITRVRALWADPSVSGPQIARLMGRTRNSVNNFARFTLKLGAKAVPSFDWDEETEERLKTLWANPFIKIGDIPALIDPRLSRGACCGKADRLGLPRRRKVSVDRASGQVKPNEDRYANHGLAATLTHMKRRKRAEGTNPGDSTGPRFKCEPVPETAIPPGANPKILADLDTSCECRWPMGSPPPVGQGDLWLFCADARAEGSIYCAEHKRKSVAATRTPAEKAADAARMKKMRERALARKSANSNAHAFLFARERAA